MQLKVAGGRLGIGYGQPMYLESLLRPDTGVSMRYLDSLTDFFKSPRWMTNWLLATVCSLIPIIGPIVLHGWLIGGFWGRSSSDPATFPDFDFQNFSKYLTRGLWPFLVSLVFGMALFVVILILEVVVFAAIAVAAGGSHHGGNQVPVILSVFVVIVAFIIYLLLVIAVNLALKPFLLRAELTQNFGMAFDFRFAWNFLKLTWIECIVSTLFIVAMSFGLVTAGMLALCIGAYFVTGPVYFMMVHLNQQIYRIYLERGGEAVAISPTLRDEPPLLPV